jgi:F-type H+-transporting ATPase subunit epsilon
MDDGPSMRLLVLLPTRTLFDLRVRRLVAEGAHGSFCILPRHIDFTAPLVPGLFAFEPVEGEQPGRSPSALADLGPRAADGSHYLAMDRGLLVKCGDEVRVSVRHATSSDKGLLGLGRIVREQYSERHEHETVARSALARLEAGFVRRLLDVLADGEANA